MLDFLMPYSLPTSLISVTSEMHPPLPLLRPAAISKFPRGPRSCAYLNGPDGHVDADLVVPDFLERAHRQADVVQVFDWPAEALRQIVDESEDLLHLGAVLQVAVAAISDAPGSRLGTERNLEMLCDANCGRDVTSVARKRKTKEARKDRWQLTRNDK